MKIALISPKGPLYRSRGGIFGKSLRYQPLTLTTLAALVPDELEPEFELYDEGTGDVPLDIDADIIGLTVITGSAPRSYELADEFRRRGKTVVLGGPHVTLLPDEAQQHADAICTGYAEENWPQLLRDHAAGTLKPRYEQAPDFELVNLPFAKRELFNKSDYLSQAVFEATRACAHKCEFCVSPTAWGRKQFQKPIAHVIEDIKRVGSRRILFIDLNLVSDTSYARELFTALIPLKVRWFGLATSLIGRDPSLMDLMQQSGCTGLLIGFESILPEGLGSFDKKFNDPSLYAGLIKDLHKRGISIQGCFLFGNDEDSLDTFDATAEFVIETRIDLPRFAILTPFPSTPLFKRFDAEGRITTRNWELYDGQHVVFRPKNMTEAQLLQGHERAWKEVYRWGPIFSRMRHAGTQIPLSLAANIGYRYYAHHLHSHYTCDWPQVADDGKKLCASR